jgi:hypothetical protein
MHKIEQLRHELLKQGCPPTSLQRMVQEVADHGEDLHQSALAEGLSASDAEIRAQAQLGEPVVLAERLVTALKRSSWCGRHPVMSFCLLPLVIPPVIFTLSIFLGFWLELAIGYGDSLDKVRSLLNQPKTAYGFYLAVQGARFVAIAMVPAVFCWLARRSALDFKWVLIACVLCSLHSLFYYVIIVPHNLSIGYLYHHYQLSSWVAAAIPWLVMAATYAWQRRFLENFSDAQSVAA